MRCPAPVIKIGGVIKYKTLCWQALRLTVKNLSRLFSRHIYEIYKRLDQLSYTYNIDLKSIVYCWDRLALMLRALENSNQRLLHIL